MSASRFAEKDYDIDDRLADLEADRAWLKEEDIESQPPPTRRDTIDSDINAKKKDTVYLDGLRGVAALCVFTYHFMGGGIHQHGFAENGHYYFISLPFIRIFYDGGSAAVHLFFVISGYVLSQSPLKLMQKNQRQKCKRGLIASVIRRPFRLYFPCFAVSFCVALLMHVPGKFFPDMPWSKPQNTLGAEISHWFERTVIFFQPFREHGPHLEWYQYNLAMWTIPLELKGSMLVFFFLAVICLSGVSQRHWVPIPLFMLVMYLLALAKWTGASFLAGLALAVIDLENIDGKYFFWHISLRAQAIITHALWLLGWFLLTEPASDGHKEISRDTPGWYYLTNWIPDTYPDAEYYRFWNSYGAILFVYGALRIGWLQSLFTTRPIRYLGKISYMFYLVHLPLMYCIGDRFKRAFGEIMFASEAKWWDNMLYITDIGPRGLNLRWDINWTIMFLVVVPVAHLATKFIDKPSVTIGKKVCQLVGLDRR